MWNVRTAIVCILLVTEFVVAGQRSCSANEPSSTNSRITRKTSIAVTLRRKIDIDSRIIRLGDVATIACSDTVLRDRLKQLDLEDALTIGESILISATQIKFRLQVAGIEADRISIHGTGVEITARDAKSLRESEQVTGAGAVSSPSQNSKQTSATALPSPKARRSLDLNAAAVEEGSLEREIIQAAQSCILGKLPWPADTVDIRLAQPVPADVRQAGLAEGYECTADLKSSGPAVGRVQVRVVAEAPNKTTYDVPVVLDVRHFDKVVVTSRSFERGHVITPADLYVDRQDVTDLTEYCSSPDEMIGLTLKRSIRALQVVRMNDLDAAKQTESLVLIKRRDQVKMIARVGSVSVSATGEALQDGRLGETIRLRNLESNATIQGRVARPGEVEISY